MTVRERQELLVSDYGVIENSFERFQIIVDTAHLGLGSFPGELRTDDRLVAGCLSRVWVAARETGDGTFEVLIDSEAPALKSLGALFCRIYSGGTVAEIVETAPEFIEKLSLDRHLTPTRLRGLHEIRKRLVWLVGEER
jgi:cysteine desulfuration protein SufE